MLTPLFFIALMALENPQNLDAIGDAGERGPLQIRPIVVRDVNRIYGTTFTLDDCFDYDTSVEIARLYLEHWGKGAASMVTVPNKQPGQEFGVCRYCHPMRGIVLLASDDLPCIVFIAKE